jgi:hypothetical protein
MGKERKEPHAPIDTQPISFRDFLRAVFLPSPEEDAAPHFPQSIPLPRFSAILQMPLDMAADEIELDATAPLAIEYENRPIALEETTTPTRRVVLGIGTIAAILLGALAQVVVSGNPGSLAGLLLYGLSIGSWLGLLLFELAPPDGGILRRGPRTIKVSTAQPAHQWPFLDLYRVLIGLAALALSCAAYALTYENLFQPTGVAAWVGSVLAWLLFAAERSPQTLIADAAGALRRFELPDLASIRRFILPGAAMLVIIGGAAFFRFYRLDAIPNEMTSDHVEKLLDSYDVSQGIYHVFFTRNGGREAIQFYLVALASRLFGTGITFLTLKLVSALEALALIPFMFLLGRELVDRETGLFAAALLALSWWHTALGRLALRIALTPLVFTLLLIVLLRGIRTGSRRAWVWAGVWMGVGVYAYQALRITPLVALIALLAATARPAIWAVRAPPEEQYERQRRFGQITSRQLANLALAGLIALAIFVPMLRVWHDFPAELWNRVINRTTSSEVAIAAPPLQVFTQNYLDALRMFNVRGDTAWISALPNAPMLDLITGSLFVLGVAAWLVRLRVRKDPADGFVLAAGLVMLLPSALAIAFPIENPSATRASSTIPIVFVLAAWPLALIWQRWRAVMGRIKGTALSAALIAVTLAGVFLLNFQTYFVRYDHSYRSAALNPGEVAREVRAVIGPDGSLDGVWLQGWPYWHDYRAIGIEAGDITFSNALIDTDSLRSMLEYEPHRFSIRPLVFIVHPEDDVALQILSEHFPEGKATYHISETPGRDFILFVVSP